MRNRTLTKILGLGIPLVSVLTSCVQPIKSEPITNAKEDYAKLSFDNGQLQAEIFDKDGIRYVSLVSDSDVLTLYSGVKAKEDIHFFSAPIKDLEDGRYEIVSRDKNGNAISRTYELKENSLTDITQKKNPTWLSPPF